MVSLHPWRVSLFRRPRDGNGRRHLAIKNDEVLIDAAGTTARRVRKPRRSWARASSRQRIDNW